MITMSSNVPTRPLPPRPHTALPLTAHEMSPTAPLVAPQTSVKDLAHRFEGTALGVPRNRSSLEDGSVSGTGSISSSDSGMVSSTSSGGSAAGSTWMHQILPGLIHSLDSLATPLMSQSCQLAPNKPLPPPPPPTPCPQTTTTASLQRGRPVLSGVRPASSGRRIIALTGRVTQPRPSMCSNLTSSSSISTQTHNGHYPPPPPTPPGMMVPPSPSPSVSSIASSASSMFPWNNTTSTSSVAILPMMDDFSHLPPPPPEFSNNPTDGCESTTKSTNATSSTTSRSASLPLETQRSANSTICSHYPLSGHCDPHEPPIESQPPPSPLSPASTHDSLDNGTTIANEPKKSLPPPPPTPSLGPSGSQSALPVLPPPRPLSQNSRGASPSPSVASVRSSTSSSVSTQASRPKLPPDYETTLKRLGGLRNSAHRLPNVSRPASSLSIGCNSTNLNSSGPSGKCLSASSISGIISQVAETGAALITRSSSASHSTQQSGADRLLVGNEPQSVLPTQTHLQHNDTTVKSVSSAADLENGEAIDVVDSAQAAPSSQRIGTTIRPIVRSLKPTQVVPPVRQFTLQADVHPTPESPPLVKDVAESQAPPMIPSRSPVIKSFPTPPAHLLAGNTESAAVDEVDGMCSRLAGKMLKSILSRRRQTTSFAGHKRRVHFSENVELIAHMEDMLAYEYTPHPILQRALQQVAEKSAAS